MCDCTILKHDFVKAVREKRYQEMFFITDYYLLSFINVSSI